MTTQQTFRDRNVVLQLIKQSMVADGEGSKFDPLLLDGFADLCEDPAANPASQGLELLHGRWVVRDDDLELFKVTRDAVMTLASTTVVTHSLSAATIASLAFGVAALMRNARRSSGNRRWRSRMMPCAL